MSYKWRLRVDISLCFRFCLIFLRSPLSNCPFLATIRLMSSIDFRQLAARRHPRIVIRSSTRNLRLFLDPSPPTTKTKTTRATTTPPGPPVRPDPVGISLPKAWDIWKDSSHFGFVRCPRIRTGLGHAAQCRRRRRQRGSELYPICDDDNDE